MKFLEIVKRLQLKNHGYIVIIKNGIFFIGIGKDAILLNKILGLKLSCMKTGLCKAGFIAKSIEKYINLLSFAGKSFVVYQYSRKSPENEEEVFRYNGEAVFEDSCSLNCSECPNRRESDEEIIERVKNSGKEKRDIKSNELKLIPKMQEYIQYMINCIFKLPRTEKFSIGTEYKLSMYKMLRDTLYISKIDIKERLIYINAVDSELNTQRIYLRIMKENYWIDEKKFNVAMEKIYEMGKIIGGLVKYYAKNN